MLLYHKMFQNHLRLKSAHLQTCSVLYTVTIRFIAYPHGSQTRQLANNYKFTVQGNQNGAKQDYFLALHLAWQSRIDPIQKGASHHLFPNTFEWQSSRFHLCHSAFCRCLHLVYYIVKSSLRKAKSAENDAPVTKGISFSICFYRFLFILLVRHLVPSCLTGKKKQNFFPKHL